MQNGSIGDLLCFSHLRWHFVTQRPQHLLRRAARRWRVFYWEEPVWEEHAVPTVRETLTADGVTVLQPVLPWGCDPAAVQCRLVDDTIARRRIREPLLWFYTPAALEFAGHLGGRAVVYDCMDELSCFAGADPSLPARERALLARADVVFTGGASLYAAKRALHDDVHAFPSGVDVEHFRRPPGADPVDQAGIPHPRIGFFGVLDERLDLDLLAAMASARPDLHFVLLGPLAKLDEAALPLAANLHYLGPKDYASLPDYIAHWDVAMLPFALNAATRMISPTKTPEYLAAGRAVVSTPVRDVVATWGETGYVAIAKDAAGFVAAIDAQRARGDGWRPAAETRLQSMSWDAIWAGMSACIEGLARPALALSRWDVVVTGAGFSGAVLAERLAAGSGQRVLVVDRRPHIGGNAFDRRDAAGLLIHPYGPHIFHTNAQAVVDYLSRFTGWRRYEHRVLSAVGGRLLPVPINRTTVNAFFGVSLKEEEVEPFLQAKAVRPAEIKSAADLVLATVGPELFEAIYRHYTFKQWGCEASALDKSVTGRLAVRTGDDDRYFTDWFQAMPAAGYTRMFEAILSHPNITVALEADFRSVRDGSYDHLVYSGPVDEFFDCRFGKLPYRSLTFRHETLDRPWEQPVGTVNYPSPNVPFTRVTEFKHITGEEHDRTSLCYEYPAAEGEPYYPVPCAESAALYRRYRDAADSTAGVTFAGRLGTYRYYNMDQVVAQALTLYDRLSARRAAPAASGQFEAIATKY